MIVIGTVTQMLEDHAYHHDDDFDDDHDNDDNDDYEYSGDVTL